MANLPEVSQFDPVYQLEPPDPVQGGIDGVSNTPLKGLANRTRWLKDRLDALMAGEALPVGAAPLDSPDFTGDPSVPTPALGDNDTSIATTAFVQGTIGVLVKSVAGGGNVPLAATEAGAGVLIFTGELTANIAVIVPTEPARSWWIANRTTGNFALTVRTPAGVGVVVRQGRAAPVFTDGVNVEFGQTDYPSIAMTGQPTAPTPPADANTAQVPTTAWVMAQGATVAPPAAGEPSPGESTRWARADHRHPPDPSVQGALGFTPVRQGGGAGQSGATVRIGGSGARLKAQVADTDLGYFVFDIDLTWSKLGGKPTTVGGYGITDAIHTGNIGLQSVAHAINATFAPWAGISGKPTTVGGYGITDAIHTANIGQQSVAHAATAASVTWGGVTGKPFNYAGQPGTPPWVWGTNDGATYSVWSPANFSVNYANSAGNASSVGGQTAPQLAPPGQVAHFARSSAPPGWLPCNGAAVSRATYGALFAAIGTQFGAGDGASSFNLPDLRGEFIRGWDNGRGVDAGRGFGGLQGDELRSHQHLAYTNPIISSPIVFPYTAGPGYAAAPTGTSWVGGNETRPRNVALLACIKY